MVNLEELFNECILKAREELNSINLEEVHSLGISKKSADLLGSHTVVTYPPLDALQKSSIAIEEINFSKEVDLYVHIPFCEYPCKFCPYTTLNNFGEDSKKIPEYFFALKKEILIWSKKLKLTNSKIHSLYIGGGTPFSIQTEILKDLLKFLKSNFDFIDLPEICIETSPRAILKDDGLDKLQMLLNNDITRISIGIQSFDLATLKDTARTFTGHKQGDEEKAVQILLSSGLKNLNIDMIQDLPVPFGINVFERLKNDLFAISRLKPQHITWYNLRLRPETTYALQGVNIISEEESLLSRLIIWNFLGTIGYEILEGDRFVLSKKFEDNFRKTRGSVDTDLLGIGVSSYSHTKNMFFQNCRTTGSNVRADSRIAIVDYINRVSQGNDAITLSLLLSQNERLCGKFALGLKKGVNLHELQKEFQTVPGLYSCENILFNVLNFVDAGLLEFCNGVLKFTRKGMLWENEICEKFYSSYAVSLAKEKRKTVNSVLKTTNIISSVQAKKFVLI
ncbi:MAG: hypothetical protein Q7K42_04000 [Candidatus Diapherotrites archaeon]|nr:hypothetical protein [Candidatus Diapherotrites archaeon]